MNLTELFVRRPVLATVVNLLIVLIGLVSFNRLTVREYPNIDTPTITVQTNYRGAPASVVESQITKPLEDQISGIEGIDYMTSISRAEGSQITVMFRLDRNADEAASDVRDRVSRASSLLPEEADTPVVAKTEADAQPIIFLSLSSTKHDLMLVSDYAARSVRDRLQTIPGVSNVRIFGERKPSMRVWLDPEKLAAYHVTPQDIESALRTQNVDIPAGRIESNFREFTVLTESDVNTVPQFQQLVVANRGGSLIKLGDVARVAVAPAEERTYTRFNGANNVGIGIIRQSTANPVDVSNELRKVLPEIQSGLPEGMKIDIAYDSSVFIKAAINSVYRTIAEAVVMVALVIFAFLASWRASIIPLVTVPISLVGAFGLVALFGFSINTLTLLALVLAIGLVVDDAIVVLENIHRHLEEGMKPLRAAISGIREIAFAVLAMTLTLAAVFAPLGFSTGRTGKLFAEFALTLAGAVIISGFIALTLSPMMCSKLLQAHEHGFLGRVRAKVDHIFGLVAAKYESALNQVLEMRRLVVFVTALVALAMGLFFWMLPKELAPTEDRGVFFSIMIAPEGSTPDYLDASARQAEEVIASIPELAWRFVVVGFPVSTQAFAPIGLQPWSERSRSQMEIVQGVFPRLIGIPGILALAINPPSLGVGGLTSRPIEVVIQTGGSYAQLDKLVSAAMGKLRANSNLQNLDTDLKLNKPELRVVLDREKMAEVGVGVDVLGRTLESMLGGRQVTRYKDGGEQYDVIVQVPRDRRSTPSDLSGISVRAADGSMVQVSNLVRLEEGVAPRELNHFNKLRSATITATLASGYSQAEGLQFVVQSIREAQKELNMPNAQIEYGGQAREFLESGNALLLMFVLALAFIYLVLSAQFESFVAPTIIMVSVPLAMFGAMLTLKLVGGTLNVYSQIGLLTLIGLITKHGIMMVEFANVRRERDNLSVEDAIRTACMLRLRPILMTTAATVLGALPLALAHGAGAESREQIGWVIVGGMTLGTLLTLFVIPVIYTYLARYGHVWHENEGDEEPSPALSAAPVPVAEAAKPQNGKKGPRA